MSLHWISILSSLDQAPYRSGDKQPFPAPGHALSAVRLRHQRRLRGSTTRPTRVVFHRHTSLPIKSSIRSASLFFFPIFLLSKRAALPMATGVLFCFFFLFFFRGLLLGNLLAHGSTSSSVYLCLSEREQKIRCSSHGELLEEEGLFVIVTTPLRRPKKKRRRREGITNDEDQGGRKGSGVAKGGVSLPT